MAIGLCYKPVNKESENNSRVQRIHWFYQYLLNYEAPHLSLKAAGHICVFHLQPVIWNVMHHYAKLSIVVTLVKSCAVNTILLQNNHTKLCVPLLTHRTLDFSGFCLTSWNTVAKVQRDQTEKSLWFHLPSMRWDCDRDEKWLWQASQQQSSSWPEFQLITSNFFKVPVGAGKLLIPRWSLAAYSTGTKYGGNLRETIKYA